MDVIIYTPGPQAQSTPMIQTPYGYGPSSGHPHGGPGFLLPLLIVGGFLFLRAGDRRRRWARRQMQRPTPAGGPAIPEPHEDDWNLREDPRDLFRRTREQFFSDGALGIVRERYARGEINADEYETLRRTLSGEGERQGPDLSKPDSGDDGLKL